MNAKIPALKTGVATTNFGKFINQAKTGPAYCLLKISEIHKLHDKMVRKMKIDSRYFENSVTGVCPMCKALLNGMAFSWVNLYRNQSELLSKTMGISEGIRRMVTEGRCANLSCKSDEVVICNRMNHDERIKGYHEEQAVLILGLVETNVDSLIDALKHQDAKIRGEAAGLLWKMAELGYLDFKTTGAIENLIQVMNDVDSEVRKYAALALGELGDKRAIDVLIRAVSDEDSDVRKNAILALGGIRDTRAVKTLIKAIGDKNITELPCVWRPCNLALALSKIGSSEVIDALVLYMGDNDDEVRECAICSLERMGERALKALIQALSDQNCKVREGAAYALSEFDESKVVKSLIQVLSDTDPNVRAAAVYSLGEIRDANARDALIQACKDPNIEVSTRAKKALKMLID